MEIGEPAVGHCLDAFGEVLGAAQPVLLDQLALGRRLDGIDEAAAQRLSRRDHASGADWAISRASACAAPRTSACGTKQVGETDAHRFVAGNAAAGVEQQRRLLRADKPRQRSGQAETRVKAEPVEIGAEPRLGR